MRYLTQREYQEKLERIAEENIQIEYQQNIKKAKLKMRPKIKIPTSKLFCIYLFTLLNAIVIYAMVAMWNFSDLAYLGALITDIAAQVLVYGIYCMKAYKAKKSEEELKFEKEKFSSTIDRIVDSGEQIIENIESTFEAKG